MSKERARRRAAREHEAGLRAAARASAQERRERQVARKRALRAATTDRLGLGKPRSRTGRQDGILARRRRRQTSTLVAALVCLNIVIWVVRPDWPARLAALVVTVLVFPVLRLLLFSRR